MNKATNDCMLTNIVGLFVDFLQVLSFIIPPTYAAFDDHASARAFRWDRVSSWWLGDLAALLRGYPLIETNHDALNSVFYIVLCAVIFMVVNAGTRQTRALSKYLWTFFFRVRVMNFVLHFFAPPTLLDPCVLAGFVFYLFAQNDYKALWTMTLLRTTAALMFGPLYIPWCAQCVGPCDLAS
jgi:hypothetical protein